VRTKVRAVREWATAPIVIPRWMLQLKYVLFSIFGLVSAWLGAPSLDMAAGRGYVTVWGAALTIAGILALVGASADRLEPLERLGVILVGGLTSAYTGSVYAIIASDPAQVEVRAALAVAMTIVLLLPTVRGAGLIIRHAKRRAAESVERAQIAAAVEAHINGGRDIDDRR
jgi:FtsH-binding integral membrane protein